ncbi:hypothetical protein NL154_05750 [Rhizobium sp. YTUHZ044]|uniref:hypothetical protein n=1 Tax=Rhizobium sp. YTUHZ044 TaxID=2962678 RepID=UPI003DA9EE3F
MSANGGTPFDPLAQWARLSERVENQGKDIVDLRSNMNTGFQGVNANLAALSNELRSAGKTHWPVIFAALSVVITILAGLGFLSLQPIKDNTARLETALARLAETTVSQNEMEWRTQRGAEDRKRQEESVNDLRATTVSRNEWSERNHARDGEITELSRRIDELRQQVGGIYGATDVIKDLQNEVKMLRQRQFEEAIAQGRRVPE